MTARSANPRPGAAAAVIRAMARELVRQQREGSMITVSMTEDPACYTVEGRVNLAMLAMVTEAIMRAEFG